MADPKIDPVKARQLAKGMESGIGDKMADLRRRMAESLFGSKAKGADDGLISEKDKDQG